MPLLWDKTQLADTIQSTTYGMLKAAHANGGANREYCRGVLDLARALFMAIGAKWREENNDEQRT